MREEKEMEVANIESSSKWPILDGSRLLGSLTRVNYGIALRAEMF